VRRTWLFLSVLCLVASVPSPAAAEVMLEPDAPNTILFVRNGDLWSVVPDGTRENQITAGPATDTDPAWHPWHPAGPRLAFTRSTRTGSAVWIVSSDGSGARQLIRNASDPAWSDYGDQIAFVRRSGGDLDIWVADADGSDPRPLTSSDGDDSRPSWAFGRIAFVSDRTGRRSIWVMNERGRDERRLTKGRGVDTNPTWTETHVGGAVMYEHVQASGDHDIRIVTLDRKADPVYGGTTDDRAPSATLGGWFSFIRRGTPTTLRTSLVAAARTSQVVAAYGAGLEDPAVTPFHTWVRAQDDQAKANLMAAADAAEGIYGETGSFDDAGPIDMEAALPALDYHSGSVDSPGPTELSVDTTTDEWGAAAISYSGYCYFIRLEATFEMLRRYAVLVPPPCDGEEARSATSMDW
jgi:hypothetical protein